MKIKRCPRCNHNKYWKVRRGKLKCSKCRYEWTPNKLPLRLTLFQWKRIVRYFLLGLSSNKIVDEVGLNKKRVLRVLNITREVMLRDIPDIFDGTVEVDETYIGGQWKNKRKSQRIEEAKRGRGTLKTPVLGILLRGGKVWAEVVSDVEARTLIPLISRRVKRGSTIFSDTWRSYTGIATRGYVHRLIEHGKEEFSDKKGGHINGLEGFWGYLKRNLMAKGGIRKARLSLYLGEYVWRFNHRNYSTNKQLEILLSLLYDYKKRYKILGG